MYEQNYIVERKHKHIVDLGVVMLSHVSLPITYWDEAFFSNVFIINHIYNLVLSNNHLWKFFLTINLIIVF